MANMKENILMTPGPTQVPPSVLLAMARPMIHHRTPEFDEMFYEVSNGLKEIFQTKNDVYIFASSGTGALEASVSNILCRNDSAIVIEAGKFGERFTEICKAYGANVIQIKVESGDAVDPSEVERILSGSRNVKAVYATLLETSTGVVSDIKRLAEITAKTDAVLVVDAVSGLGIEEIKMDEWGVDVIVSASQKALMLPPGLGFISLSEKAWKMVEKSDLPKYYFCLKSARKSYKDKTTPYTPAVSLVLGLKESLRIIKSRGIENIFKAHGLLAKAARDGVSALGLKLFSKTPSNGVTAVVVPDGVDGEKLVKSMRDKYGVTIAGGQSELKGKIFRISHMGYVDKNDVIAAVSSLEFALAEQGHKFNNGDGVRAAQKTLLNYNTEF